jgi:hypothetical protein
MLAPSSSPRTTSVTVERGAETRAAVCLAVRAEDRRDPPAVQQLPSHRRERRARGTVPLQVVLLPEPLPKVGHQQPQHGNVVVHDDEQRLR